MKMEISAGQLSVMRANFPFLEFQYSTVFVIFNLTKNQDDHHVVWIRGSIDGVYLAKMALMVIECNLFQGVAEYSSFTNWRHLICGHFSGIATN